MIKHRNILFLFSQKTLTYQSHLATTLNNLIKEKTTLNSTLNIDYEFKFTLRSRLQQVQPDENSIVMPSINEDVWRLFYRFVVQEQSDIKNDILEPLKQISFDNLEPQTAQIAINLTLLCEILTTAKNKEVWQQRFTDLETEYKSLFQESRNLSRISSVEETQLLNEIYSRLQKLGFTNIIRNQTIMQFYCFDIGFMYVKSRSGFIKFWPSEVLSQKPTYFCEQYLQFLAIQAKGLRQMIIIYDQKLEINQKNGLFEEIQKKFKL